MYKQIKQLADEAIALQNKDRMDAALREISACCGRAMDDNSYTGVELDAGLADASKANRALVEKVAAETGGEVVSYGEAKPLDMAEDAPTDAPAKPAKKGGAK
jgi:hypothetical protein